jgi:hypothetical protein
VKEGEVKLKKNVDQISVKRAPFHKRTIKMVFLRKFENGPSPVHKVHLLHILHPTSILHSTSPS